MKFRFKFQTSKFKSGNLFVCLTLLCLVCWLSACSVPNMEAAECSEARTAVKEFYSFHFGNDMNFTPENLTLREKFLSPEFIKQLQSQPPTVDPFTLTNDTPKAFRVGGCTVAEANRKTVFEVLLFWKTDTRSEQRAIYSEFVKQNNQWLLNKISNKAE